jgi:pilus assembly protein Flp/PilA
MFMARLITTIRQLLSQENGQDLIEYGLLAALVAIVVMASVSALGDTIYNIFWKQIGQAI